MTSSLLALCLTMRRRRRIRMAGRLPNPISVSCRSQRHRCDHMAITCPVDLDTLKLRAEIQAIYTRVAADPSGEFHFHRGPAYAATRLHYDAAELSSLPASVTESF